MMFPFNLSVQFSRKKNTTANPINNCLKFEYTFLMNNDQVTRKCLFIIQKIVYKHKMKKKCHENVKYLIRFRCVIHSVTLYSIIVQKFKILFEIVPHTRKKFFSFDSLEMLYHWMDIFYGVTQMLVNRVLMPFSTTLFYI